MDQNKINKLNKRLESDIQDAKDYHFLLYNSLLTFNSILLTAFSLMVTLNPSAYSLFIIPYFSLSLITITIILILIFESRQFSFDAITETFRQLYKEDPNSFNFFPDKYKQPPEENKKDSVTSILQI